MTAQLIAGASAYFAFACICLGILSETVDAPHGKRLAFLIFCALIWPAVVLVGIGRFIGRGP